MRTEGERMGCEHMSGPLLISRKRSRGWILRTAMVAPSALSAIPGPGSQTRDGRFYFISAPSEGSLRLG